MARPRPRPEADRSAPSSPAFRPFDSVRAAAAFVAAVGLRTLLPSLAPLWGVLVAVARQSLVLTLFLIGTGLMREVLRRVGVRLLAQGVVLWFLVSAATLAAIVSGLIQTLIPALSGGPGRRPGSPKSS